MIEIVSIAVNIFVIVLRDILSDFNKIYDPIKKTFVPCKTNLAKF